MSNRERQQRYRDNLKAGRRHALIPVGDDFADFAVWLGVITEAEAETTEGRARAAIAILDSHIEDWKLGTADWGSSNAPAPKLTPAEKVAWVRSRGIQNASEHELHEAIKAAGLWHRWW